jgi:GT2 family glycosyltransferase
MDLSIFIISFNTRDYLKNCVNSIYRSRTKYKFEIVVVDNNSKDQSADMVEAEFPAVLLIRNLYNYGFATAMNQAYRVANGKYVMSFNPDAEVFEDTIELALDYLENNPTVGKIGLATLDTDTLNLPHYRFNRIEMPHLFKIFGYKQASEIDMNSPMNVEWIFGTGLVIRRSILPLDHLYSENSFLFWEEFWLSEYIRQKGYQLHILPSVKILHHASVTFKKDPVKVFWARVLSHSHEWRVRKSYFGRGNANLNSGLFFLDNLIIYSVVKVKSFFVREDPFREIELLDRKARFLAGWKILTSSEKSIVQINLNAATFFNDGVTPPYPPVTP